MKFAPILAGAFVLATASLPALADANGPMLAQACAGCHGQQGAGMGSVPDIRGYDREAFIRTWEAFRNDERPATIMNRIARGYTDAEVAAMAEYFATLE